MLQPGEDHPRDPEEDDVVAGDEHARRVIAAQVGGVLRPAERGKRPECGREPCVQHVLLAAHRRAAVGADVEVGAGDDGFPAGVAVEGGNAVPPPKLAGNAPVVDVVHPVHIYLFQPLGQELDVAVRNSLDGRLGERGHFDKPLIARQRLDRRLAAIAAADVVRVVLDLDEIATGLEVLDDAAARLVAVQPLVFAAEAVDGGVVVHHANLLQPVALADEEVVRVVRGRDLHAAGAEFLIHILVRDDRNLPPDERKDQRLAHEPGIALVVRADGDGGVAQQRLRTRGGDDDIAVRILDGITDMPEMTGLFLVLDLGVRKRGRTVRTPVDNAGALVNISFFV